MIGNREKAVLHIAKQKLGMSEEAYRDMLGSVGCTSSTELTQPTFEELMERLRAAGFESRGGDHGKRKSGMHRAAAASRDRMLSKIGAILADLGLPWSYADGTADRMFGVEKVRWCQPEQLHKVVAALSYHQKRVQTREKADG